LLGLRNPKRPSQCLPQTACHSRRWRDATLLTRPSMRPNGWRCARRDSGRPWIRHAFSVSHPTRISLRHSWLGNPPWRLAAPPSRRDARLTPFGSCTRPCPSSRRCAKRRLATGNVNGRPWNRGTFPKIRIWLGTGSKGTGPMRNAVSLEPDHPA
jgi:hypothetical protein